MKKNTQVPGKFLYAVCFAVVIPAVLWYWGKFTEQVVLLPVVESKTTGGILISVGGLLMLWAMFALLHYGKGLPMNAYPPPVFVTGGPYRLFRHPIYWGFGLLMIGCFLFAGSASGIWLVSPLTILGMVALVLGHESIDLKRRFPDQTIRTVLDYPESKLDSADLRDRLTSLFWLGSILTLSNFMIGKLNGTVLPLFGESLRMIPVPENSWLSFLSILFILFVPFLLKEKETLRTWEISGFIALACSGFMAFLYPAVGAQYLPAHGSVLPAVPVFLLLLSLKALYSPSRKRTLIYAAVVAVLVIIQLSASRSAALHLAGSLLIYLLSAYHLKIWIFLQHASERIANSWKEWVFGKVRVINHGFYAGFGTFLGVLLAGILAGKEYAFALLVFTLIVNICAGLWAQLIEGSAKLKRPFGYYGGLLGGFLGSFVVWILGYNAWVIVGVCSVAMPWVQAIGRLRCLVNGCCHGRKSDNPLIGIRYFHPRSRVCTISGLKGEPLHPTQLYAILWLTALGLFLLTLWNNDCSSPLIFGLYLILTSLGRFVEEAYRGEVQTPVFKGLHLYQWTAILALITGIILTTVQIEPAILHPGFNGESVLVAFISGLFVFFAMGVDFPHSNARFSRLV